MVIGETSSRSQTEEVKRLQELRFLREENIRLSARLDEAVRSRDLLVQQLESSIQEVERTSRQFRQALEIESSRAKDYELMINETVDEATGMSLEELLDSHANLSALVLNLQAALEDGQRETAELKKSAKDLTVTRGKFARDLTVALEENNRLAAELEHTREQLKDQISDNQLLEGELDTRRRSIFSGTRFTIAETSKSVLRAVKRRSGVLERRIASKGVSE